VRAKVETRGLGKAFRKADVHVEALRDLNLRIGEGEFVGIVGASGCGKTTLLRLLDGLLEPTSGTVLIDGRVVTRPGPDRGFVFQQDRLFPWRTVEGNAVLGPELQRREIETARRLARAWGGDVCFVATAPGQGARFEVHFT